MPDPCALRTPVRAAFAFAGGGSLGTYLVGATRVLVSGIRRHNAAVREGAPPEDPRYLRRHWGHITIDAVAGTSAGALCSAQLVKALFEPDYADDARPLDAQGTCTGDWINGADFARLRPWGSEKASSGPIEAPGWTLMSGARLYQLAATCLTSRSPGERDPDSPLDPSGVVAIGITLTDLLGYHDPAEFSPDRVLGHPEFGCARITPSQLARNLGRPVRDLGGTGHAEVRKLFIARDEEAEGLAKRFLAETRRRGRARCVTWSGTATERLAALCTTSAALPFAIGPLGMTDRAADIDRMHRRLYMDGGIMNNRPVAPALELARWHDMMRLLPLRDAESGAFRPEDVLATLRYERVCFFLDAFPDRREGEWQNPHPDTVFAQTGTYQLVDGASEARHAKIRAAIDAPTSGLDAFATTVLNSMRAQDMRVIARINARLVARAHFIDRLLQRPPYPDPAFTLSTPEQASAWAAVMERPLARDADPEVVLRVASRVWEADGFSELEGRRMVTMVPVFAPANLEDVFAGEGLYALGGLLHREARVHDARVGAEVAEHVLAALRSPSGVVAAAELPTAPAHALPRESAPVVERLQVLARATLDASETRGGSGRIARLLTRLPLVTEPLLRVARAKLDELVVGRQSRIENPGGFGSDDTP